MTVPYDRDVLTTVLVYHWPTSTSGCHCGWGELGKSHPEHVVDVYEQSVVAGGQERPSTAPLGVCTCGLPDTADEIPPRDPACAIHGLGQGQ